MDGYAYLAWKFWRILRNISKAARIPMWMFCDWSLIRIPQQCRRETWRSWRRDGSRRWRRRRRRRGCKDEQKMRSLAKSCVINLTLTMLPSCEGNNSHDEIIHLAWKPNKEFVAVADQTVYQLMKLKSLTHMILTQLHTPHPVTKIHKSTSN